MRGGGYEQLIFLVYISLIIFPGTMRSKTTISPLMIKRQEEVQLAISPKLCGLELKSLAVLWSKVYMVPMLWLATQKEGTSIQLTDVTTRKMYTISNRALKN